MRISRWYMASIVSALVVVGIAYGTGAFQGSRSAIVVEWGLAPETLEGCEVEIDGEIAGMLQRVTPTTRTGFEVKDGSHTIAILHPEYYCEVKEVTTGGLQKQVVLVADLGSWAAEDSTEMRIFFQ